MRYLNAAPPLLLDIVQDFDAASYGFEIRDRQTGSLIGERVYASKVDAPRTDASYVSTITAVAWHPHYLVVAVEKSFGATTSQIQFWPINSDRELLTREPWHTIEAHNAAVLYSDIGSRFLIDRITHMWWDDNRLYTIGVDGTLRVWGIPD